jgi:hypothetical protein
MLSPSLLPPFIVTTLILGLAEAVVTVVVVDVVTATKNGCVFRISFFEFGRQVLSRGNK